MYPKLSKFQPIVFFALGLSLVLNVISVFAEDTATPASTSYLIQDIKSNLQGDALSIEIVGNNQPVYTMYELFNPARLILDIANATLDKKIEVAKILPENKFAKISTKPLTDQDPSVTRFEITINESHSYSVDRDKNNLMILIHPKAKAITEGTAPVKPKELATPATTSGQSNATPILLQEMTIKKGVSQSEVLLVAGTPLKDFQHNIVVGKKGLPDMMFIDIPGVDGSKLARETEVGTALSKIRIASKGTGIRLLFDSGLPKLFEYTVTTTPQGLLVTIQETNKVTSSPSAKDASPDPTMENLISSSQTALDKGKEKSQSNPLSGKGATENSFNFGGYKDAKRISVDFFKIDLHNVFRLFRDVSGVNIIVDEEVKGSLTLALNDVPWDFALDIILNLKDLRKEEKFNTIVIYPAKKEFIWPERAQDNLAVETDLVVQQEQNALVIEQSAAQSEEVMQSKELIRKGRIEEKGDNIEKAVALYEQALKIDPKNTKLSNRLASLYLANLGINAKAVYFAKETLKIEPKNTQAALYAAIGLANMNQIAEATDYFAQSISDSIPMKEALISYATFNEQNQRPDAALKLLAKYNTIYGESVNTMVAKARIFDKMNQQDKANDQYRALLASGYQLEPGMKEYIQGRLSAKNPATGN